MFCHDFQNTICSRLKCKFVHGSRQDEDYYKTTGELPKHISETFVSKGNQENLSEGEIPLCKDFLKCECQRGKKCKFLHISDSRVQQSRTEDYDLPDAKRRHHEDTDVGIIHGYTGRSFEYGLRFGEGMIASPSSVQCAHSKPMLSPHSKSHSLCVHLNGSNQLELCVLHEENLLLRRKVEDLKKQVGDLMATNEFLLEQNTHYRIQGKYSTATNVATVRAS